MKSKMIGRLARWASVGVLAAMVASPALAQTSLTDRMYEDAKSAVENGPGEILSPDEWEREFPQLDRDVEDSTHVRNTMESGILQWDEGEWSDCEVTSTPYCSTYTGIQRRPVDCVLGSAKGTWSQQQDGNCLGGVGPKPPTNRSCTLKIEDDCQAPPAIVSIAHTPAGKMLADGEDRALVTAIMRHSDGTRAAGEDVTWAATQGVINRTKTTTDGNGETSIYLTSDEITTAKVTASSWDSEASTNIQFIDPTPEVTALSASPRTGLTVGEDTSTLTATLKYGNGRPAEGYMVRFDTSLGALNTSRRTSNSNGKASVVLRSDSTGTANVTATSKGSSQSQNVGFVRPSETQWNGTWGSNYVLIRQEWREGTCGDNGTEITYVWNGKFIPGITNPWPWGLQEASPQTYEGYSFSKGRLMNVQEGDFTCSGGQRTDTSRYERRWYQITRTPIR